MPRGLHAPTAVDGRRTPHAQGELLDQIEYQVKGAANYVEEGTLQVQGAIEHAKKARP